MNIYLLFSLPSLGFFLIFLFLHVSEHTYPSSSSSSSPSIYFRCLLNHQAVSGWWLKEARNRKRHWEEDTSARTNSLRIVYSEGSLPGDGVRHGKNAIVQRSRFLFSPSLSLPWPGSPFVLERWAWVVNPTSCFPKPFLMSLGYLYALSSFFSSSSKRTFQFRAPFATAPLSFSHIIRGKEQGFD